MGVGLKVGDKVIIRSRNSITNEYGNNYGELGMIDPMMALCGREGIIKEVIIPNLLYMVEVGNIIRFEFCFNIKSMEVHDNV